MSDENTALSPEVMGRHDDEVRTHFRRNYMAHIVEGGLFMGGLSFTHPVTVLPKMAESLGGEQFMTWASVSLYIGFMLPGLFTSHWIERLDRMHPLTRVTGVFQRLPYLVAGLILLLAAGAGERLGLWAILLTPFFSGLAGGLSVTAWQELVAKTIPANRRASLWASRYIVSALIGLGAGFAVKAILRAWPGTAGYGVLHLCTFVFLLLSYIVFCSIRETSLPPKKAPDGQSFVQYLAALPALIRGDRRLALYMPVKVFSASAFVVYSFLSAHVLAALDRSESFLGSLLIAQMAGILIGNLGGGRMGNRFGGRAVLLSGYLCFLMMTVLAFRLMADWQAYVVFFLFGVSFSLDRVGSMTFDMDVAPIQKRVAYFAVLGVVKLAGLLLASILGPAWRAYAINLALDARWTFPIVSLPILLCIALSFGLLLAVREPRKGGGQGH